MKVPRPLRLATDVSRPPASALPPLGKCREAQRGHRGRSRSSAASRAGAALGSPRPRGSHRRRAGEVARVGGEASGRGAPDPSPCAPVPERDAPAAARPADGPATVASWSGASGGPGRRSPRRRGGRGPTPRGGKQRRERARPPYVSEDGVRSTPRVEGGVRRVHWLTRSNADKGHLEAEATAARGSAASCRAPDSCSASAVGAPQATWPRPAELSPPPGGVPQPAKPQPEAPGMHSR